MFRAVRVGQRALRAGEAASNKNVQLRVKLVTPYETIFKDRVAKMIGLPTAGGRRGILRNGVPTIAELAPGCIKIYDESTDKVSDKYFVAGGFAVMNKDSTCVVTAVECVPLDSLDLAVCLAKLDTAKTAKAAAVAGSKEQAEANIQVNVFQSMKFALEEK